MVILECFPVLLPHIYQVSLHNVPSVNLLLNEGYLQAQILHK